MSFLVGRCKWFAGYVSNRRGSREGNWWIVASTVCSSKGLTGTKVPAESDVVTDEMSAFKGDEVVIGRAKEDVIDFYTAVRMIMHVGVKWAQLTMQ